MVQYTLTVCIAIGDVGHPVAVGVATNEMVTSDGAPLIADVTAPAIGVAVVACHCGGMEDVIAFAI
jgi:hypothetical protein